MHEADQVRPGQANDITATGARGATPAIRCLIKRYFFGVLCCTAAEKKALIVRYMV